jgi:hypothetical protein
MKQKRFQKKLGLNKRTVAHLNQKEMNVAKGGVDTTIFVTLAGPYTCLCSYNTGPMTCCDCPPNFTAKCDDIEMT